NRRRLPGWPGSAAAGRSAPYRPGAGRRRRDRRDRHPAPDRRRGPAAYPATPALMAIAGLCIFGSWIQFVTYDDVSGTEGTFRAPGRAAAAHRRRGTRRGAAADLPHEGADGLRAAARLDRPGEAAAGGIRRPGTAGRDAGREPDAAAAG